MYKNCKKPIKSALSSLGLENSARKLYQKVPEVRDLYTCLKLRMISPVYYNGEGAIGAGFETDLELRVFGLRRSGNHAVINWIFQNSGGSVCFLNCVRPKHHLNPFIGFGQSFFKNECDTINISPGKTVESAEDESVK